MVKLSDYLNYLNNEVIQARKMADENAIKVAKEYAKHEYLKYFTVPRFAMPSVKMSIPIKINELDSKVTYNFKRNYDGFVSEMNDKIKEVNEQKELKIKPVKKEELLKNKEIVQVFDQLEKHDYKPVKNLDENLGKVDFQKATDVLMAKLKFSSADSNGKSQLEKEEYEKILKTTLSHHFTPVNARLNELFIDPQTTKETDKGKVMLMLDVEMVEEGIRIRSVKDRNGNELEEIVFE